MLPIFNLFETDEDYKNLSYFAAIVSMAAQEGAITESVKEVLFGLADKLKINEDQCSEIVCYPWKYTIEPLDFGTDRLPFVYDLFKMIYTSHKIDDAEEKLIHSYAVGLGFSDAEASAVVSLSIEAFKQDVQSTDYMTAITAELLS